MEHPDALEKRIRFGCGFILGLVIAAISSLFFAISNGYYVAALCLVFGVIMGFGAMEYGDEFWDWRRGDSLRPWWWWF